MYERTSTWLLGMVLGCSVFACKAVEPEEGPADATAPDETTGEQPTPDAGPSDTGDSGASPAPVDGGAPDDGDGAVNPKPDSGAPDDTGDDPADAGTGTDMDTDEPDASLPLEPDFFRELATAEPFSRLAGPGSEVKYLTQVDGRTAPDIFEDSACLFQNTRKFPYHVQFLRSFAELSELSAQAYEDWVLRRESRTLYGGMLKLFAGVRHPATNELGVLAYTVYTEPSASEQLTLDELIEIDQRLEGCVGFASDALAFLPQDTAQLRTVQAMEAELNAANVSFLDPARLDDSLAAEGYSEGEAYGYLQLATQETALNAGPRDIVVVEAAPNELGLVAGLLTQQPQSVASHLNLRLREKGVPNARAPEAFESGLLEQWQDLLVHLRVTEDQVEIEPAQLADAQAFWDAHAPVTGEVRSDLETTACNELASLEHADALAYGVKAANLGELNSVLPAANTMLGFAVPFRAYADFVAQPGLQAAIDQVLGDPELRLDAAYKRELLKDLRRTLRDAPVPAAWEAKIHSTVEAVMGEEGLSTRLRFRSSTNAEDLPGVSGAGLYDSASGCIADDLDDDAAGPSKCLTATQRAYYEQELETLSLELDEFPERVYLEDVIADLEEELSEEKSAARAIKKVWASLWNDRAFDDREYYRIDHRKVLMGMAVHPSLVGEQLEAVVVTNLEPETAEPLYRVVSQRGEVGVVSPYDPSASPEIVSFRRGAGGGTDFTLVAQSSIVPEGTRLWSATALEELAALLFDVQDHFESNVYPELDPLFLDIEVDVDAEGEIRIKQARPYANTQEPATE